MDLTRTMERAHARHATAAADLHVISARKFLIFLIELPPRNVHVHAAEAIDVMPLHAFKSRNVSGQAVTGGIGKILADHSGWVSQTIRVSRALRVQEQAR